MIQRGGGERAILWYSREGWPTPENPLNVIPKESLNGVDLYFFKNLPSDHLLFFLPRTLELRCLVHNLSDRKNLCGVHLRERHSAALSVSSRPTMPACHRWEWTAFQLYVTGGAGLAKSSNCLASGEAGLPRSLNKRRLDQLLFIIFWIQFEWRILPPVFIFCKGTWVWHVQLICRSPGLVYSVS